MRKRALNSTKKVKYNNKTTSNWVKAGIAVAGMFFFFYFYLQQTTTSLE